MSETPKRFLLFAGETYYAAPGWRGFVDSFDTLEEAIAAGKLDGSDWWQVVDLEQGEIVASEGRVHTC